MAHNITVNAVASALIITPGTEDALAAPRVQAGRPQAHGRVAQDPRAHGRGGSGRVPRLTDGSLITGIPILIDEGWTVR
jgi:hypothetical protein